MKKILIIICVFFLFGCQKTDINSLSHEEIIKETIKSESKLYNVNNKGYRYYLPNEFSVIKDADYVQELLSHNNIYYLNIDVVSYYYKNNVQSEHDFSDYEYLTFENNDINGYLRIKKNNDNFFVELCYNYAIIEVEVEESELNYAISRGITILNSIKYNDLIIDKYINDNSLDSSETIYKLPEPKNKNEDKNILQYIEENEKDSE